MEMDFATKDCGGLGEEEQLSQGDRFGILNGKIARKLKLDLR